MRPDTSGATSPRPRRRRAFAVVSLALLPVLALTLLASHLLAPSAHASGSVSFAPAVNYAVGTNPHTVAVADLNNDGHPDLVTANYDDADVSVWFGNVDGTFGGATSYSLGVGPASLAIGDVTGDGKLDLVTANVGANSVTVLQGDGAGGFGPATDYAVGTSPYGVAIGHINGNANSIPFIVTGGVTGSASGANVSVLVGNGSGGFFPPVSYAVGSFPEFVTVANLNSDSYPDIAVANFGSNTVSVLLGDGTGRFNTAGNFSTDIGPAAVAVGDLNGDGHPDLVTANSGNNDVSVLLGDGTGGFGTAVNYPTVNYPTGTYPYSVAIGDLDSDGKPDLVTANLNSNNVSVLLGNGFGVFAAPQNFAVGTSPVSVAVADFNSDSKPDVVTLNNGSNNVSVLLNTTVSSSPTPTPTVSPTAGGGGSNTAQVTVALAPGELSATTNAAPSLSATLNGQDQTLNYALPITVTDGTATGNGWNLTITSTQFSTSGAPIDTLPTTASTVVSVASACASGTCVDPTNTVGYPLTIPAGTTAPPPVKLFNAAVGTGMGIFTVTPSVNILVPATTVAGTYTSTITLAIVSGP